MTLIERLSLSPRRATVSAGIAMCASLQMAQATDACPGQDVSAQQTVNAFNSLTDGQPGTPRTFQLAVVPSYDLEEREFQSQLTMSGVVATSGFWCQAQFALSIPSLDVGEGLIDFEKSITAGWQQRWLIDTARCQRFQPSFRFRSLMMNLRQKPTWYLPGLSRNLRDGVRSIRTPSPKRRTVPTSARSILAASLVASEF